MSDRSDLAGPLAFLAYGLLLLALGVFLVIISPVRIDRLGGLSARLELESQGILPPADAADREQQPRPHAQGALDAGALDGPADSADDSAAEGRRRDDRSGYGFEPSRRADAVELCRLWMKDTPLFEETYGAGRLMGVSGTIVELRELGGDFIILLDGAGPQFKSGRVSCYFDPDDMLPLKALRAGDRVSIVGQCSGGIKGPILKHSRLEGRL